MAVYFYQLLSMKLNDWKKYVSSISYEKPCFASINLKAWPGHITLNFKLTFFRSNTPWLIVYFLCYLSPQLLAVSYLSLDLLVYSWILNLGPILRDRVISILFLQWNCCAIKRNYHQNKENDHEVLMVKFSLILDQMNEEENEECTYWFKVLTLEKQVTEPSKGMLMEYMINQIKDQGTRESHKNTN